MSNPFDFEVPTQVAHTISVIEDTFLVPGHRYDILEIYRGNGVETYTYQPALSIPVKDGFVMRYMLDSGKESTMSMAVVPKGSKVEETEVEPTEPSEVELVDQGKEAYSDSDADCEDCPDAECQDCPDAECQDCPEDELVDQTVDSDAEVDYVSKEDISEEMSTSEDTEEAEGN